MLLAVICGMFLVCNGKPMASKSNRAAVTPTLEKLQLDGGDLTVHSKNWPNGDYPLNTVDRSLFFNQGANCDDIRLHFQSPFDVEAGPGNSCYDFVQVIAEDQLNNTNSFGCSTGIPTIARVCGDHVPADIVFPNQDFFMLEFCSDGSNSGAGYSLEVTCERTTTPSPHNCGVADPKYPVTHLQRIIGGNHANPHSWPWNAVIWVDLGGTETFNCGGSLINENWVLTTSSCNAGPPEAYRIKLGADNKGHGTWDINEPSQQLLEVSGYYVHPQYDPSTLSHDVALIKLKTPAMINEYVKPVCLPVANADIPVGEDLVITGWGRTDPSSDANDLLMQTKLTVVSNDVCTQDYNNIGIPLNVDDSQVCAGPPPGSDKGICYGDAGDPLMVQKDGAWVIDAVGSFGGPCFSNGLPSGASRITYVMDWIEQTINNNS